MEPNFEMLQKAVTPEVFAAIGVLTAGWLGWKVAGNACSVIGTFCSKASFAGLAATLLALGGMGTAGFGVGEIATRDDNTPAATAAPKVIQPGVQNTELENFAKTFNGHSNPELAKLFLDYARERDGLSQRMSDELIQDILTKTTEHNQQAAVELIKLFRAREERRHVDGIPVDVAKDDKSRTASAAPLAPLFLTSLKTEDPVETKNFVLKPVETKESSVTLPVAYSMLFGGIASTIGGCIVAWRTRKTTSFA